MKSEYVPFISLESINTLRPRQNGRHFPDDTFRCILLNENIQISIRISLKFVLKSPINNILSLIQIMAWRHPGDKAFSEPMVIRLLTHICVTRPQWVNAGDLYDISILPYQCMTSTVKIWRSHDHVIIYDENPYNAKKKTIFKLIEGPRARTKKIQKSIILCHWFKILRAGCHICFHKWLVTGDDDTETPNWPPELTGEGNQGNYSMLGAVLPGLYVPSL